MLNIHPSLLPAYRGLHTHRRVLEAGDTAHGASVHFVTRSSTAAGRAQSKVAVEPGDTEATLSARVQATSTSSIRACSVVRAAASRMARGAAWLDGGA